MKKFVLLSLLSIICFAPVLKAQDFRDDFIGTYNCTKDYCSPCSSAYNINIYVSKDTSNPTYIVIDDYSASPMHVIPQFNAQHDSAYYGWGWCNFYQSMDSLYIYRYTFQTNHIDYYCKKTSGPTSIYDKQDNNNNFEIYPNPTFEKLYIKQNVIEDFEIALFDITGRQVNEIIKGKSLTEISVADLDAGIYFVKIKSGKGIISKKIMVQR